MIWNNLHILIPYRREKEEEEAIWCDLVKKLKTFKTNIMILRLK